VDAGRRGARDSLALPEMVHDALDHCRFGDETHDAHLASTATTHERVDFIHAPDQIRPTTPQRRPLRRCRDGLL
jgi:hypothetical protein